MPHLRRPVVLDPPPAYMAEVPLAAVLGAPDPKRHPGSTAERLLDALAARGIVARPTLAEVEAERARRGMRRGLTIGDASAAPRRVVLPIVSERGRETPDEIRAEARRNRARIESALGERVTLADVDRIYFEDVRRRREERRRLDREEGA